MSDQTPDTWANASCSKADIRHRKIQQLKSSVYMFLHACFWRTLWALKLGTPYSKLMCRLELYKKFPDGRCMYCGEKYE